MRVRKLTSSLNIDGLIVSKGGDYAFGRGLSNFYIDDARGVAQTVETNLRLFVGDFFLDKEAGTPWRTKVLGKYTGAVRDIAIRTHILQVPGVKAITAYSSSLNRDTREFGIRATISTIYGPANVNLSIAEPT